MTCGAELHPERALKYDYCTAPDCQARNLKGLTMVAVGMNKAAEEFLILDEQTAADLASGKYRDQRRGLFGPAAPIPGNAQSAGAAQPGPQQAPARRADVSRAQASAAQAGRAQASAAQAGRAQARQWTARQERLALLYNQQGMRPDQIAAKLGISSYLATQIVLTARQKPGR